MHPRFRNLLDGVSFHFSFISFSPQVSTCISFCVRAYLWSELLPEVHQRPCDGLTCLGVKRRDRGAKPLDPKLLRFSAGPRGWREGNYIGSVRQPLLNYPCASVSSSVEWRWCRDSQRCEDAVGPRIKLLTGLSRHSTLPM